jgi:molecular chaperone GrpE
MKKKLLTPQAVPEAIPALATEDAQQENVSQALQKAQEDLAAANEKHLRLYSEFENFRRRVNKEKIYLMEAAGEGILKKLLPIADDFERALASLQSTDAAFRATKEGISLIHEKFIHLLQQEGVQPMPLEKGTVFDAEFHEAVTQIPAEYEDMKGKVIEVLEKGYLLKEKVLRFAKVVTGA